MAKHRGTGAAPYGERTLDRPQVGPRPQGMPVTPPDVPQVIDERFRSGSGSRGQERGVSIVDEPRKTVAETLGQGL